MEKFNGLEKGMYSESYTLFLKYKDMANTEQNWTRLTIESNILIEKFGKCEFIRDLVVTITKQIEKRVSGKWHE